MSGRGTAVVAGRSTRLFGGRALALGWRPPFPLGSRGMTSSGAPDAIAHREAGVRAEVTAMLDHVFVSVSDLYRSIEFYERALASLGIRHVVDYDGANGPEGPGC